MSAPAYRGDDGTKAEYTSGGDIAKGEKDSTESPPTEAVTAPKKQRDFKTRIIHSFHRREFEDLHPTITEEGLVPQAGDTTHLHRKLKGRHLQMIAIGGAIGAGLFIGSGRALATGGPGAVLLDFGLIGIMLFCTVNALGELATLFPVQGSFSIFSTRFIDPAWGFAMGWNYAMQWLTVFPFELVAAGLTVRFWNPNLHGAIFISIFWVAIVGINLCGVRGYGEAEFIFSIIKVTAVIGFIILGIVIDLGGAPNGVVYGTKYWHNPGSFNNGFKGVCSVFVTAAFAFAGTELAGLAAAETENPRKTLPRATKQVTWRIIIFYMVSLTVIGCIVPYTEPRLLNKEYTTDIKASPFVIAVQNAGIKVVPSIMNAVILISVLSVGNSSTYGATRTLQALAEKGQAPKIFMYIDKRGRPLVTLVICLALGLIAYVGTIPEKGMQIFDWLFALSGLSSFFTWGSICFAHIRFRAAMKAQNQSIDDLPFQAVLGVWGSWFGLILNALCIIAQFYIAVAPIGGKATAYDFFVQMLALPIIIVCYVGWKLWHRTRFVRAHEADLLSGRRELDLAGMRRQELEERATWRWWKKAYYWLC
jgi:amino acid transporter